MDEKPEIVRIKLEDDQRRAQLSTATKAFQVKIDCRHALYTNPISSKSGK